MSREFASWNRLPNIQAKSYYSLTTPRLPDAEVAPRPLLTYGNGRSYGDVCLNSRGTLLLGKTLNKIISFDAQTGVLRAYAGMQLNELLAFSVPQGWFLPTTPGTSLITLGGAVANDVHGKNHHIAGTFGHHIRELTLIRSDADNELICSKTQNSDLFYATIGGLGLTGLITEIEIELSRIHNPLMWCENRRFCNIEEYWSLNAELQPLWPCAASWLDCFSSGKNIGRGIMFLGKHAAAAEQPFIGRKHNLTVPVDIPFSLINNLSVRLFNDVFFKTHKSKLFFSDYRPFFYPLDSVYRWNRIYGYKGFYQYQCILPPENEKDGMYALLDIIRKSKQGSALVVLKSFGTTASNGLLSFPRPGTTLALDFPNKGKITLALMNELDQVVCQAKGALYPAKDARMSREMFELSYPQLNIFRRYVDPQFSSHFWERMNQ